MTAFAAAAGDLEAVLLDCASGRELVAKGFGHDIPIAAESDLSDVVPRVTEGVYLAV
jgi:2-phosphosulfolactate phosphatase